MQKEKHALMIGGGIQEVEAVIQLKKDGWYVGVTDRNPNCPCKRYSDYLIVADGKNPEEILREILFYKNNFELPNVIFTLTELTTTAAILSKALGLVSPSIAGVVISQSKGLSKKYWLKNDVSTPMGVVISDINQLYILEEKVVFPCVVKPDVSFGGQGVSLVKSYTKIKDAIKIAMKYSSNGKCVIEKYVVGSLHDANGFFSHDGSFIPISISDRFWSNSISVEGKAKCPSSIPNSKKKSFFNLFEKACRCIGIEYGPVKIDMMFDGERFYVLEVAARLHGPRNSLLLIPNSYDRPLLPEICNLLIGKDMEWNIENQKYISIYEEIQISREGTIKNILGLSDIQGMNNITHIQLFMGVGDKVKIPTDSSQVVGYLFSKSDNERVCIENLKTAKEKLIINID